MIEKTKGIVLQQIRYGDNSRIIHVYTEMFGKLVFMVKGLGKKSGHQRAVFFPLALLDLGISYKPGRTMQNIREAHVADPLINLHTEMRKTSLALFLSEVLARTLTEEEANPQLFRFLYHSVLQLDREENSVSNFHLFFLAQLTRHLGFQPINSFSENNSYFDLREGLFVSTLPSHPDFLDKEDARVFSLLFFPSSPLPVSPPVPPSEKKDILEKLLHYYQIHLEGMGKIKSLNILHDIFH